ncbi:YIP1 family protein [Parabacteroides sp. OttesenSCG-928-G07]|nr:YIP1 family protein [Parabacteroides sp. OttesenSCG-928-G21]MDL2278521.1 YIP1 family protein [Parabacteroides sp. OttesenSCG-928-G07]
MKTNWGILFFRPFEKIAGRRALFWGILGLLVSILLSFWSGYHYHGLLHYGAAPNDALWVYVVEHLVIWLVPALLFLLGGLMLSKSKVRALDVMGTTVFALLPMLGMNLFNFLPPMQKLLVMDVADLVNPESAPPMTDLLVMLLGTVFTVWMLIWLFNALKVSCNLKGTKLVLWYIFAVVAGDVVCRFIISWFYSL